MKAKQQRKLRGYKITDKDYNKAMMRANKEKHPLATSIEKWVIEYAKYGQGYIGNVIIKQKD